MKLPITLLLTGVCVLFAAYWLRHLPKPQRQADRADASRVEQRLPVPSEAEFSNQSNSQRASLLIEMPLDTERERQTYYDGLLALQPIELFHAWKGMLNSDKERHKGLLEIALADSLKQSDDTPESKSTYIEITSFLQDENEFEANKIRIVKLLGQSGTSEALALLLKEVRTADGELRVELLRQLDYVGSSRWNHKTAETLSALLEVSWKETFATEPLDIRLLGPLTRALARVGAPGGIELLLEQISQFHGVSKEGITLIFASFNEVRNPASVPTLSASLLGQPADSLVLRAAGSGLANIGSQESAMSMISWAQAATDEYADVAEDLFMKLRHPMAIKRARYVFVENRPFKSEKVRGAVQKALANLPL